jgi:hypothetical protein
MNDMASKAVRATVERIGQIAEIWSFTEAWILEVWSSALQIPLPRVTRT